MENNHSHQQNKTFGVYQSVNGSRIIGFRKDKSVDDNLIKFKQNF